MPIGGYSDFSVEPTCGLVSATGLIGFMDDPSAFYEPDRLNAQLLWFRVGFVEYRFPNRVPPGAQIDSLQLTAEICSEAPLHHLDWPSDIGVWVNGILLGEWTCPSDFGGQRGRLTPSWWEEKDSQFGVLKRWLVTEPGHDHRRDQPLDRRPRCSRACASGAPDRHPDRCSTRRRECRRAQPVRTGLWQLPTGSRTPTRIPQRAD